MNRDHTNNTLNGLIVRPATLDDLEAAVAMFNACSQAIEGVNEYSVEQYAGEWQDPTINLEEDTRLVLTPAGQVIGCVELWNWSPHVFSWVWGRVHPDYEGQGVGATLMQWAESRARQRIAQAPAEARVVMNVGTVQQNERAARLFVRQGFAAIRHSWRMVIDLNGAPPLARWPEGIAARAMRPGEEAAIYRASDEAFSDHWGHVETPFESGFARFMHRIQTDPDHDPSLWFLALDGDEIAGISLCWPHITEDPGMGWVGTLAVRRPWRRRGLGLALLQHSFHALHQRGQRKIGLGVDAGSLTGATRLYERAGMRPVRHFDLYEKELRSGIELSIQSL